MTAQPPSPRPTPAGILQPLLLVCAALLAVPLLETSASAQEPGEDESVSPGRIGGAERSETAARIGSRTFDEADVAVLATGLDFPDALAGSFAAGHLQAPILLVEPDAVPESTLATLGDLGVETVVLLGGTAVIGQEVEDRLEAEGYALERVAGETRYDTAAQIALRYGEDHGGRLDGDRPAILASGEDFPDALSAGPLAARAQLPLLLTPRDGTLPVVDDALDELGIERILVVGGQAAVSDEVLEAYADQGYAVERLAGSTRDETAAVVADNAIGRFRGFSDRLVLLARGDDFPDALAASVHGAIVGAPILLTATPDVLGVATDAWLAGRCPGIDVLRALGGPAAVTESALGTAVGAAERCLRPEQEVARFTTPLTPDPDRTHNLHLAADYIDGDVIPPGATYSLNEGIGRRTGARGFRVVQGGCIGADGQPVDCRGGGVSQMGTTFMNAAWFTGVDIPEFQPHSVYISRYPICHEATLTWGQLDVRVRNDSPYDIVVDTFYSDETLGVRFVSREWAQVESWSEPAQPPGSGPFTSRCGRTITYPDGSTGSESYEWTYDDVGGF